MTPEYEIQMTALLARLGADDPQSFLSSEKRENIPQIAHFLFVHEVRKILAQLQVDAPNWNASPQQTTPEQVLRDGIAAARALETTGVSRKQLNSVYQLGVCDALSRMLNLISGSYTTEGESEPLAPSWCLVESAQKSDDQTEQRRIIGGAHEYFEALYPSD